MTSEKCTHAGQWLDVYHSAVQSGYDRGYADALADNDRLAELVSRKIEDRDERQKLNAAFVKRIISGIDTEAARRKFDIK